MFVCGCEVPIQPNNFLLSLNEETGDITVSSFEHQQLKRYSFIWLGKFVEVEAAFSRLLEAIRQNMSVEMSWVIVWNRYLQGGSTMRPRWLIKKYARDGWAVHYDDDIAVATTSVPESEMASFMPPHYTHHDGYMFMFLGVAPQPQWFVQVPLKPTINLSANGKFAPSGEFLSWLAAQQYAVAYSQQDDLGRYGLVVVGGIEIDVINLNARGIIQEVKMGDEAERIWQYPWTI